MENELKKSSVKQLDYETRGRVSAKTNPLFYSLHGRFRSLNKKGENYKLPFSRSFFMPKLPAAQVLNYRTCIIDRNLNKHIYISTISTNRVKVNFAFTCDGHVIGICAAPASETGMMKCLHGWEFYGHIWKQGQAKHFIALAYDLAGV